MTKLDDMVDLLDSCTTSELGELVPMLEDHWGVECPKAPKVIIPDVVEVEQTEFDAVLIGCEAAKRIKVIKEVRALTSMSLKEARDVVYNLPFTLVEQGSMVDCEDIRDKLAEVGGEVVIR